MSNNAESSIQVRHPAREYSFSACRSCTKPCLLWNDGTVCLRLIRSPTRHWSATPVPTGPRHSSTFKCMLEIRRAQPQVIRKIYLCPFRIRLGGIVCRGRLDYIRLHYCSLCQEACGLGRCLSTTEMSRKINRKMEVNSVGLRLYLCYRVDALLVRLLKKQTKKHCAPPAM